jgi:DNA modification methylase
MGIKKNGEPEFQGTLFDEETLFSSSEVKAQEEISGDLYIDLRKKLPQQRKLDGSPSASDDAIIRLSLPKSYTACPSPYIVDFIQENSKSSGNYISRGPLVNDISVGKNDPLYFAHYYSTKVPPDAIVPFILHYTSPGDIVFDGFCGTGMTGVASQLCAREGLENNGVRKAVLIDLSPAATFIAANTNSLRSWLKHLTTIERLISNVEKKHSELLTTNHVGWARGEKDITRRINTTKPHSTTVGKINYVIWSDVFHCAECGQELIYWDLVFKGPGVPPPKKIMCPNCKVVLTNKTLERSWISKFDHELGIAVKQAKQIPVLINYSVGKKRYEKYPDERDLSVLQQLDNEVLSNNVPIIELPNGFNTEQPKKSHGFSHVHHFFTRRNLSLMADIWNNINRLEDPIIRNAALYVFTGCIQRVCRLNRYMPVHDRHVGPLSGTLYVSQITAEIPITNYFKERIKALRRISPETNRNNVCISTQSATDLKNIPDNSIDYIFTDPPFGGNLNYSELNILVEAWLGVVSDQKPEAVVNSVQGKEIADYSDLMRSCLAEFYRILKPGRWITVEFHNSQNAIWNSIQEALGQGGFIVADVSTLDKQKGTTKQLTFDSAVKQDLVISAYKPNGNFEDHFQLKAGTDDGVWEFVRYHLGKLPAVIQKDGSIVINAERQAYLLFDRMVAFHIQRGVMVPISSPEFYAGLQQRFIPRDGMYFLPDQVAEYDRALLDFGKPTQIPLFVTDEKTAINWLRQQLDPAFGGEPQTRGDLTNPFNKTMHRAKHEKALELIGILEQNFLQYENGKWYVPDPNKAGDLEKVRQRSLLREFKEYMDGRGRLRQFRTEAIRAGFLDALRRQDYDTITKVAERLPENVLREDPDLLMYYDSAMLRKK